LLEEGIETTLLYWPNDERKPNTLDYIRERKIDLVINIPKDLTNAELTTIILFAVQPLILMFRNHQCPAGQCFHQCVLQA